MTRAAYYNEIDAFCCDVLRARIADGSLPFGDVDERDIRLIDPNDLKDYGQVHLFAGIGGGGLACRLAGVPDDFRIITAGVPCQPASQAGKRLGAQDERWLWPEFFRVLRALRSHYALVEQPPGIASLPEWHGVLGELAEVVPDCQGARVSAQAVGAPHERERIWLVADPDSAGFCAVGQQERPEFQSASGHVARGCDEGMGDTRSAGWEEYDAAAESDGPRHVAGECAVMGDASSRGRRARSGKSIRRVGGGRARLDAWHDAVAVRGADGTVRLIPKEAAQAGPESSLWPVADGLPGRVARLRAIGNAWVPQAAVPALRVILARYAAEASA